MINGDFFKETSRLILRSPKDQDAQVLAIKRGEEFVEKFNLYQKCEKEQILKEFVEFEHFILVLKETQEIIGCVAVKDDPLRYHTNSITLQAWLIEKTAYKGYMLEAVCAILQELFKRRGVERIAIQIFAKNEASIRLAEKLGFEKEGYLKEAVKNHKGQVFDVVLYSLDRISYLKKQNK